MTKSLCEFNSPPSSTLFLTLRKLFNFSERQKFQSPCYSCCPLLDATLPSVQLRSEHTNLRAVGNFLYPYFAFCDCIKDATDPGTFLVVLQEHWLASVIPPFVIEDFALFDATFHVPIGGDVRIAAFVSRRLCDVAVIHHLHNKILSKAVKIIIHNSENS